jgi:hypothetical protein
MEQRSWNTSEKMPPSGSAPYSTLGLGSGESSALTALQAMGSGGQEAASFWMWLGGVLPMPTIRLWPASPSR